MKVIEISQFLEISFDFVEKLFHYKSKSEIFFKSPLLFLAD